MSCICQYVTNPSTASSGREIRVHFEVNSNLEIEDDAATGTASQNEILVESSKEPVTDDTKIAVCVSELAKFRSENWLLKKKLQENKATITNLEKLMSTIVSQQNQLMTEMIQLRKRNSELETECKLQRGYHDIERAALIKELEMLKNPKDLDYTMSEDEEEGLNQTGDSQEYDNDLASESESESDSDYDDDDIPTLSPYSSGSESDEDAKESEHEKYSTGSETDSD